MYVYIHMRVCEGLLHRLSTIISGDCLIMVNDMGKIQNRILNTDSKKEFGIAVKPSSLSLLHRRRAHTHKHTHTAL